MPLDPLLANPATIKMADPMEQYGNFLKNSYLQDQIAEAKQKRDDDTADNELYKRNYDPVKGLDKNAFLADAAKSGRGKNIPKYQEAWLKQDKLKAETDAQGATAMKNKAQAGLFGSQELEHTIKNLNTALSGIDVADPAKGLPQYLAHIDQFAENPVVTKMYTDMGMTKDQWKNQARAEAYQAAASGQFPQLVLAHQDGLKTSMKQDISHMTALGPDGKQQALFATNEYGTPSTTQVPGSLQNYIPKVPTTTVNVGAAKTESEYGKAIGKGVAETDLRLRASASAAPKAVGDIDSMLSTLDKGDVITGAGGEIQTGIMRVLNSSGFNVDNAKLEDTQVMTKQLSQHVLDRLTEMKNSGLPISRATNMELEQLKNSSPSILQEPATIRRLLLLERKMLQEQSDAWKSRLRDIRNDPNAKIDPSLRAVSVEKDPAPIYDYGVTQAAVDYLMKNRDPKHQALFEKQFHLEPGAAKRYLDGGASNGGATFP